MLRTEFIGRADRPGPPAGPDRPHHVEPAEGAERARSADDPCDRRGARGVARRARGACRGAGRGGRAGVLRRRRYPGARETRRSPASTPRSRRSSSEEYALNRVIARYPKPYIVADRRHLHGGRHRPFRAWHRARHQRACGVRDAGDADRLLSRCRRHLRAAAVARRVRHVSGADQRADRRGGRGVAWLGDAFRAARSGWRRCRTGWRRDGVAALAEFAVPPPATELRAIETAVTAFAAPSVAAVLDAAGAAGYGVVPRHAADAARGVAELAAVDVRHRARRRRADVSSSARQAELALALRRDQASGFCRGRARDGGGQGPGAALVASPARGWASAHS